MLKVSAEKRHYSWDDLINTVWVFCHDAFSWLIRNVNDDNKGVLIWINIGRNCFSIRFWDKTGEKHTEIMKILKQLLFFCRWIFYLVNFFYYQLFKVLSKAQKFYSRRERVMWLCSTVSYMWNVKKIEGGILRGWFNLIIFSLFGFILRATFK